MRAVPSIVAALLLAGCQSYVLRHANVFSDEDGRVVRVDYGQSDDFHVNTFVNPATGRVMDFRSKLVVEVTLPDGDDFTAWQCMNFQRSGTMYKTDDDEWMLHANGFTCSVYRRAEDAGGRYRTVFRGVLCETPKTDYKPSDKWRTLKKDANTGQWK